MKRSIKGRVSAAALALLLTLSSATACQPAGDADESRSKDPGTHDETPASETPAPGTTDKGSADTMLSESTLNEPTPTESWATEPGTTDPLSAEPSTAAPDTTEASTEASTSADPDATEATTDSSESNPYARYIPQPTIWTREWTAGDYRLGGIASVRKIGLITGDGSMNRTRERFAVGGTDLGVPVYHKDRLYLWFGDTFFGTDDGQPMGGGVWRNNVLAVTDDLTFDDGLEIDDMFGVKSGKIKLATERISGKKIDGEEMTVIPTGSVSVNGKLYLYFMSVRHWGPAGQWDLNPGGLAVSDDDGESFHRVEGIAQDPDRFGQFAATVIGDYVYGIGIGGGRFGPAYLGRVPKDRIEEMEAYEYLTAMPEAGLRLRDDAPIHADLDPYFSADAEDALPIVEAPVGEPSIMYNAYLDEYMLTYLDEGQAAIVLKVADNPWGPWSESLILASGRDYPALYGGFTHEILTEEDGRIFYFILSQWDPIYNTILFQATVTRRDEVSSDH